MGDAAECHSLLHDVRLSITFSPRNVQADTHISHEAAVVRIKLDSLWPFLKYLFEWQFKIFLLCTYRTLERSVQIQLTICLMLLKYSISDFP